MIARTSHPLPGRQLLVLDLGNSSTKIGIWNGREMRETQSIGHQHTDQLRSSLERCWTSMEAPKQIVACSVVPQQLKLIQHEVKHICRREVLVVGRDIPLPIQVQVQHPENIGADRICTAAAAHFIEGRACTVADLGTAITVDCVNDDGAFIGGAILPGLRMQARALAEYTAALPEVDIQVPAAALGTHTPESIQCGIYYGCLGAIRELAERYAEVLGKWPVLIMTGGDGELLAGAGGVIDRVIPQLCLRGIALSYERAHP